MRLRNLRLRRLHATGTRVNANAPLLFFDSGVGGLSVLGPTLELLPTAPIVYAADSAAFPYGTKSEAEIASRVPALLGRFVERFRPRLVVIACNTACTIALDHVRSALDVPVVGTVPAIKPAAEMTRTGVIGVLGTLATVRQPYVDRLVEQFASHKTVLRHGTAELVELAEAKLAGEPLDPAAFKRVLAGLFEQPRGDEIDTIVLSSTHFPLVEDELRAAAARDIRFVHGGPGIARRIAFLTQDQPWPGERQPGLLIYTGGEGRRPLMSSLARYGIGEVRSI